jgi:hypothetical protein
MGLHGSLADEEAPGDLGVAQAVGQQREHLGVGLGIALTGASLWRSRAVPRTAAALLVVFLVLDVAGQGTAIVALSVIAHVIGFLAAGWIALAVLRVRPLRGEAVSVEQPAVIAR